MAKQIGTVVKVAVELRLEPFYDYLKNSTPISFSFEHHIVDKLRFFARSLTLFLMVTSLTPAALAITF